jgi:TonB-dependent receptor
MLRQIALVSAWWILVSLIQGPHALSATSSKIEGVVKDAQTGDPLPGANILLVGTGLGSSADINGRYVIRNVPPGSYTIRATYLGYKLVENSIEVQEGVASTQDFQLVAVALEGETVIVTAQALGQNEAINQQLAAPSIVSVVSSARIQELPDANAAESVGRLPGVSILRSGGEGNQVVIRGLQPKYNLVLVDGVKMASSNPADRSTDLSMISPYMLEGIEVTKAVTADQDGDVLGGTVNFKIHEARVTDQLEPGLSGSFLAQGGYNGLANAYNKYNNYKYVGSIEGRFFDGLFGVFGQADLERRNLSSNEFGATYDHLAVSTTEYITRALNLNNIPRDRRRANGTLVLDYRLPEGKISLMNFVSSGTTDVQNRAESFDIQGNIHNYSLAYSQSTLNMVTNALTVEHQLPIFHALAKLSHTYSETKAPDDWTVAFIQTSAGLNQFINQTNVDPQSIPRAANNNFAQTILSNLTNASSFSRERALTASLDLDTRVNISDRITSVVKFGGKYRYQKRSYDYEQFNNNASFASPSARIAAQLIASHFPSAAGYDPTALPITAFTDRSYDYGKFLDGNYTMVAPLSYGMMAEMARFLQANAAYITQQQAEGYAKNNLQSTTNDYTGHEDLSAFYLMATVNVGPELTIIPGVRYQNLKTSYEAARGIEGSLSYYQYYHYDTTVTESHGYWLPHLILRYKPLSWFDLRLSYTNTLAYPDYNAVIPRIDVATTSIAWNNHELSPSRSRNFDAYASFYDNSIGLFTIGGFLKQIDDLIYPWTFYVAGAAAGRYYPPGLATAPPTGSYSITTYVNDSYRIDNWGLELDWQTHFWYLPDPFKGLVLNVNYTHIFSDARYPYQYQYKASLRDPVRTIDTSFTDRLLFQPNNIVNLSLGYDYDDLSLRLSMLYQDDIFTGPNFWPQLRSHTSAYTRWDLSAKQKLPWFGLQVFGDLYNINGANDISIIQRGDVPRSEQSYGMTADLGLRWIF